MQARNETRVRKSWKLSLGLATLVLLCLMTAAAQTRYTVTDLGTLGGTFGVATNIANMGAAVGGYTAR